MTPQDKYHKEKMTNVSARFKNDFVFEFKEACKKLNIKQSDVIRQAMVQTIEKSKEKYTSIQKRPTKLKS